MAPVAEKLQQAPEQKKTTVISRKKIHTTLTGSTIRV
jgi:hypothetical protein